ncbi:MAG: T9SS type A sorting domain-containing protein [Chlorobi bacterium]|nr:T9SS type A sorting domain-containing protein [Chlorobiota bacterium]
MDNCTASDNIYFTLDNYLFECANIYHNDSVRVTGIDLSGNSSVCYAHVEVRDSINPTAICRNVEVFLDASGEASITAQDVNDSQNREVVPAWAHTYNDLEGGSYDACGIESLSINKTIFTCVDLGANSVTLSVIGSNGNIGTCVSTVTVIDNNSPNAKCNDITIELNNNGTAVVIAEAIDNGSYDVCGNISMELSQTNFTCADIGGNIVKLTIEDNNSNYSTCTSKVQVRDNIKPHANCKDVTVELDTDNFATINTELIDNNSYDNCGLYLKELNKMEFTCTDVGTNPVILTVTDNSGNISTCSSLITVVNNNIPNFDPVPDVELFTQPGICDLVIDYPEIIVNPDCGIIINRINGLGTNGIFPIGVTTECYVASNSKGETDTLTFNVIISAINDAPTINPLNDISELEDVGTIIVPLTNISYGADCEIQSVTSVNASCDNTSLITEIKVDYFENGTGYLEISVAPDMYGESEISIEVIDDGGTANGGVDKIKEKFSLSITPVNDPPVLIDTIADQEIHAARTIQLQIYDPEGSFFEDVDDILSISAFLDNGSDLPGWMSLIDGILKVSPLLGDTGCVKIVVVASDLAGSTAADTFNLCVKGYVVGIDEFSHDKIILDVYPNPTQGPVNIKFENGYLINGEVSLLNYMGKEIIKRYTKNKDKISFDLSNYVSGLYFVQLNIEDKVFIKKLVLYKE